MYGVKDWLEIANHLVVVAGVPRAHVDQRMTWDHWINRYARNPNFVRFWNQLQDAGDLASYDAKFVRYVDDAIRNA